MDSGTYTLNGRTETGREIETATETGREIETETATATERESESEREKERKRESYNKLVIILRTRTFQNNNLNSYVS